MPEMIDDLPHQPTGERFWGEHYLFWGQDRARGAGFMMHFARMPFDPHVQRGMLIGFLPDDKLLLAKHVGRARSSRGPGTDAIWAECVEPFKSWDLRIDGVGQVVERRALLDGCLADGPPLPVKLNARFTTVGPPWETGKQGLAGQPWASYHMEQGCSVEGEMAYGTIADPASVVHRIEGAAYRDHSVGVRHETVFRATSWINGVFPESGRTFGLVKIGGAEPWLKGFYADKDGVRALTPLEMPDWSGGETLGERYALKFELDGAVQTIEGEVRHAAPQMIEAPNHLVFGFDRKSATRPRLVIDQTTRLSWNGEEGFGWDQRTGKWGAW